LHLFSRVLWNKRENPKNKYASLQQDCNITLKTSVERPHAGTVRENDKTGRADVYSASRQTADYMGR